MLLTVTTFNDIYTKRHESFYSGNIKAINNELIDLLFQRVPDCHKLRHDTLKNKCFITKVEFNCQHVPTKHKAKRSTYLGQRWCSAVQKASEFKNGFNPTTRQIVFPPFSVFPPFLLLYQTINLRVHFPSMTHLFTLRLHLPGWHVRVRISVGNHGAETLVWNVAR